MQNSNYCVIMAGGIGSRFWPISRSKMPKQFLDILNQGRTLIQQTYDRFSKIIPDENIYIVTNEEYRMIVKEQLPNVPNENILGEPMKRNTAPCIMYANCKIFKKNPFANIVVTPADHLIADETEFIENIKEGLQFITNNNCLLTFGIKPDRPSTTYGYIQLASNDDKMKFHPVKTFTEKPHIELAKFFVSSGDFMWNSGIFLWKLSVINEAINKFLPELYALFTENINKFNTQDEQKTINQIYSDAKSISIDFGVMEKADDVFVIKTDFGWSDLGTWDSLYSLKQKDDDRNVLNNEKAIMNNSNANYIYTKNKDKLLIINDISDYIIVDVDDALLICKRENEQQIAELLNKAKHTYGDIFN